MLGELRPLPDIRLGFCRCSATSRSRRWCILLAQARERAGLTQTEYATQLGEFQYYVARLESGQRRVDVVELIAFSNKLGFDPVETVLRLLGGVSETDH